MLRACFRVEWFSDEPATGSPRQALRRHLHSFRHEHFVKAQKRRASRGHEGDRADVEVAPGEHVG